MIPNFCPHCNNLWLKRTLWCLLMMQIYPDSILIFMQRINGFRIFYAFFSQNCICWTLFGTLTIIFNVFKDIFGKIIESRYISICRIIDKSIDIGRRLPQIINDFRELSAKLLISKMAGELSLSIIFFKWIFFLLLPLIVHPYCWEELQTELN